MLVAVSAAHGRHEVTRAWAIHTANLLDGVVVAVTEDDEPNIRTLAQYPNIIVLRVPNEPLSGKFNEAMNVARALSPDKVMVLPSDDFVSPQWVQAAKDTEHDYIYPHTCGIVDAYSNNAYLIRKIPLTGTLRFGAGRVVSKKVVEKLEGELWPINLAKGLDSASHARITHAGFACQIVRTEGIPITDVKTDENLWGYRTWESGSEPITADQALAHLGPEALGIIKKLRR